MLKFEITEAEQELLIDSLKNYRTTKELERKRSNANDNELSREAVDNLDMFYMHKISSINTLSNRIQNLSDAVDAVI